ncbi:WD40 domain-containing protein [Gigaspora margarita]|uniref:WD40 domain-containing protein n=1 Tax=Gigaspora margarita TaxID=4874 RepID=A0A8H4A8Q9_GIGMA|nr:WD40 domain-containing protein [Gigaspora margarita]
MFENNYPNSSFPADEPRTQTSGYHPRDEVDNDYSRPSDSDSDLRFPKRPRLTKPSIRKKPKMRIPKKENGVGSSTNGVSTTSNGSSQIITNGQVSALTSPQNPRREELVRLMVQAMQDMGYSKSATQLEKESGFLLESSAVAKFRDGVLKGEWDLVESLFPTLELDQNQDIVIVRFLIRQQKYLELLERREIKLALYTLRSELTPLAFNTERLHLLSSFIMYSNAEDLRRRAEWDGAKGTSRQKLLLEIQKYISPSIMVPEHRLESLLEQATTLQRISCLYHNSDKYISLYSDHVCDRSQFPSKTTHIFERHKDEVWYVAFSNNGKFLASASKDKTAIIWSLETLDYVHELKAHTDCVSFLSWSPDDTKILTCGQDNEIKLWSVESGECLTTLKKHLYPVTACAWLPDGLRFISGSQDKDTHLWTLDGTILYTWTGARIMDLAINKEGTRMVAICHDEKLHIYNIETRKEEAIMDENAKLTSICLSSDCKYALVNLSTREIHLWDIEERRIVRKYYGQKQEKFVIRSCFGGIDQGFIVSGSEDSNIYVWHREHATMIEILSGHKGAVNSVNWSPVNPYMFASAGDDHTIRLWGTPNAADHKGKMKTS